MENLSEREKSLLFIIATLVVFLLTIGTWYWNTGDDYEPAFRDGYCAAQNAEFVSPNLCMRGDTVVSVWKD